MPELILAEFETPEELLSAVRRLRQAGHQGLETYSPYPLEGSSEALGLKRSRLPLAVLLGGLVGAASAYGTQLYANAIDWPIIVGSRPQHAPPLFLPITFEVAVLFAAFAAFFTLLGLLKLPELFHPVATVDRFRSATLDAFWLSMERGPASPTFEELSRRLRELGARSVSSVPGGPR